MLRCWRIPSQLPFPPPLLHLLLVLCTCIAVTLFLLPVLSTDANTTTSTTTFAPYADHWEVMRREEFIKFHEAQCPKLDGEGRWCEFSPLFQDFLRKRRFTGVIEEGGAEAMASELIGSRATAAFIKSKYPQHHTQAAGLSFGGFHTEAELAAYRALPAESRDPPMLFVHGGGNDAGDLVPLAFLYHKLGGVDPRLLFGVSYNYGKRVFKPENIAKLRHAIEALHDFTGKKAVVVAHSFGGSHSRKAFVGGPMTMKVRKKKFQESWKEHLHSLHTELTRLGVGVKEGDIDELVATTSEETNFVLLTVDLGAPIVSKVKRYISIHEVARVNRRCIPGVEKQLGLTRERLAETCDEVDGMRHMSTFLRDLEAQTRELLAYGKLPMLSIFAVPDLVVGNLYEDDHEYNTQFPGADLHPIYFEPQQRKDSTKWTLLAYLFRNHNEVATRQDSLEKQFTWLGLPTEAVRALVEASPKCPTTAEPIRDYVEKEEVGEKPPPPPA